MFLKAARHAELDTMRGISANVMCGQEGFFGTGLKEDEYVADCSDIDDVIVFLRDGKMMVAKVDDKKFVGKDIIHIAVFDKNDKRTIYNMMYRDGNNGSTFIKRFNVIEDLSFG